MQCLQVWPLFYTCWSLRVSLFRVHSAYTCTVHEHITICTTIIRKDNTTHAYTHINSTHIYMCIYNVPSRLGRHLQTNQVGVTLWFNFILGYNNTVILSRGHHLRLYSFYSTYILNNWKQLAIYTIFVSKIVFLYIYRKICFYI